MSPPCPFTKERINTIDQLVSQNTSNPQFVKYWEYKFDFENPIHMEVQHQGDSIKLATYYQPAKVENRVGNEAYKGVIFYVHGFADFVDRKAHVAQEFAQLGYDFFAMDLRGHGRS